MASPRQLAARAWDRYRRSPKALRWVAWTLLLFAAAWLIEDLRGRVSLAMFYQKWRDAGVPLRWVEVVDQTPIPEEEDFLASPIVRQRHEAKSSCKRDPFPELRGSTLLSTPDFGRPTRRGNAGAVTGTTIPLRPISSKLERAIVGGRRYGKSDERGENVVENPVSVFDFNATIGYALGLPLDHVLYSPSTRPFTVAAKGKPVTDLFVA